MGDLLPSSSADTSSNSSAGSSAGASSSSASSSAATATSGTAAQHEAAANSNGAAAAAAAEMVAVKVLPPRQCNAAEFVRELQMTAHCRHQHLVALKVRQLHTANSSVCSST